MKRKGGFYLESLVMSVRDIQDALGIGRNAAYDLVNRSDFPTIKIGNRFIIPRDAFLRWLEAQTADKLAAGSGR